MTTNVIPKREVVKEIERLGDKSPDERRNAQASVLQWLVREAENLPNVPPSRREDASEIAADIGYELASREETRTRVVTAHRPLAYLRKMMRNRLTDRLRSSAEKRRAKFVRLTDFDESSLPDPRRPQHEDGIPEAIKFVLAKLTEKERELLQSRFDDDMTIRAIGEKLGISFSAAAKRLHRLLRKKLPRLLKEVGFDHRVRKRRRRRLSA